MAYMGNYLFEDESDFFNSTNQSCVVCGKSLIVDESFSYGDNEWHEDWHEEKTCACSDVDLREFFHPQDLCLDAYGENLLFFPIT